MSSNKHLRWVGPLGLLTLLLILGLAPHKREVRADRTVLSADGRSTARVRVILRSALGVSLPTQARALRLDQERASALGLWTRVTEDGSLLIRAGHQAGTLTVLGPSQSSLQITIEPSTRDADKDGLPDAAELLTEADRAAFTRWFTTIAEAQATRLDDAWALIHQDCAGLVRFSVREALKRHDERWLERRRYLPSIGHPDVAAFNYPALPVIGELPFRKVGGAFDANAPLKGQFTAAPGARALWQYNASLVSKNIDGARAGDLLFFKVPYGSGSRMHTMIVLGQRSGATHRAQGHRVVYHTGTRAAERGEVRLVSLEHLLAHPDPDWQPRPHNTRFLGVYRLNLLTFENSRTPFASNLGNRGSP